MKRAVTFAVKGELLKTTKPAQTHSTPICLICRHVLLRKSRRINSSSPHRRYFANDRSAILEQPRSKSHAPLEDNPVPLSVPASTQEASAETDSSKDEEALTIGGDAAAVEEGLSEAEEAEAYQDQLRREEEELYQRSVDQALRHKEYVPAETWHGLEEVGGETEKDEGETYTP